MPVDQCCCAREQSGGVLLEATFLKQQGVSQKSCSATWFRFGEPHEFRLVTASGC